MVKHRKSKDMASTDYVISNFAGPYVKWGLLVASLVIVYKHRENFPRICNGTELGLRSAIRGENRLDKTKE